ncbi:hypothetical protein [Methylomonas sp. MgM2]
MVITWKHFPQVSSYVRFGGYAYTQNGGKSWTFPDVLTPGEARSNLSVDVDSEGNFYIQGLHFDEANLHVEDIQVLKSIDGGRSWLEPVFAYGLAADKGRIAVDRTGGIGDGFVYVNWRDGSTPTFFTRSIDGGQSFQEPVTIPNPPGFGTVAVGVDGAVYVVGRSEISEFDEDDFSRLYFRPYLFAKSTNANDASVKPSFETQALNLGGDAVMFTYQNNPNQYGPIGDVQIDIDHSDGPLHGNVYILASVDPSGVDNQDVYFIRSSDGGGSWSEPVRINDDPPNKDSYQWFAVQGVADNSRIDAVWYDTRNSGKAKISQLFYAYSWDGGITWSKNQPVTQSFDTHIAYPLGAQKLGDYTGLVSDSYGAHVAYTATFNGEQDVFYLNVFPDCNNNSISDVLDIQQRQSGDTNSNHIPDACEKLSVAGDQDGDKDVDKLDLQLLLGRRNTVAAGNDDPGDLDGNGVINALDARKLVLLCTRPRCAV